jgi:hypothetical protein
MFSSLPKLADRTFVVGYLLPTLLFVCALAALFADQPLVRGLIFGETQGWDKIFGLVIAVWAAAVFLQFVNTYLIKFLEGYESPIKNWRSLKAEKQRAFDALDGRLNELWEKINAKVELSEAEKYEFQRKSIAFHRNFPSTRSRILPTRFGNAIRAFEQYGNEVYGADSVTLWSHLSTVVPKDFASAIGDARAQVDGLVNVLCFSALFALVALARAAYSLALSARGNTSRPLDEQSVQIVLFVLAALVAAALAVGAYALAIRRVYVWGAYVKAAFDCYLPELAKKLGFRMPAAPEKQKELWAAISQRVAYHLTFEPEPWMLAEKENSTGSEPNDPAGTEGATEKSKADDPEEESEDNGDDAGDDAGGDEQTAPLAPGD